MQQIEIKPHIKSLIHSYHTTSTIPSTIFLFVATANVRQQRQIEAAAATTTFHKPK